LKGGKRRVLFLLSKKEAERAFLSDVRVQGKRDTPKKKKNRRKVSGQYPVPKKKKIRKQLPERCLSCEDGKRRGEEKKKKSAQSKRETQRLSPADRGKRLHPRRQPKKKAHKFIVGRVFCPPGEELRSRWTRKKKTACWSRGKEKVTPLFG